MYTLKNRLNYLKETRGIGVFTSAPGFCKCNPRIIDNVMTTALKAGAQMQKTIIDSEVILAAVNEQALG